MIVLFKFIAGIVLFMGWVVFFGAPWVPSHTKDVEKAFTKLYKMGSDDFLVDFGAGDGKILKIAKKYGARGFGIELNPILVLLSKLRFLGARDVNIRLGSYLQVALPKETTVVYTFGDGRDVLKIYNRVKTEAERLEKTIYLISYAFPVKNVKEFKFDGTSYLYKVGK